MNQLREWIIRISNMKDLWRPVNSIDDLPKSGKSFMAIWNGRICIAQYHDDEERFWISYDPAACESNGAHLDKTSELRISYWFPLVYPDCYPEEYVKS